MCNLDALSHDEGHKTDCSQDAHGLTALPPQVSSKAPGELNQGVGPEVSTDRRLAFFDDYGC